MNDTKLSNSIKEFAAFVAGCVLKPTPICGITEEVRSRIFRFVQAVGFNVEEIREASVEYMLLNLSFFPRDPSLRFTFSSKEDEEGMAAAGWLDWVFKAACVASAAGNSVNHAVTEAVLSIQPMAPIQLNLWPGDYLVAEARHEVFRDNEGFIYRPCFCHVKDSLPPLYVGKHQNCGGNFKRYRGLEGWGRLTCDACGFQVVFREEKNYTCTFDSFQNDIRMRVLGMESAGPGPGHKPYVNTDTRPSVES